MLLLLFTIISFFYPFYVIYKPPQFLIRYFQQRWPDVLWQVPVTEKIVALTIDDAPSEFTFEILEILRENEASATFFTIGAQVPGREDILKEIVRHGNELGNHAMHDEASRSLSDDRLEEDIGIVERKIHDAYDSLGIPHPPRYFRPGSGFFSERMRNVLARLDYRLVLGSIYPHDPQIPYAGVNARHILSMVKPGGIIICHDRRRWTAPMLRKVVPELKRRGYEITTISGLLDRAADKMPAT